MSMFPRSQHYRKSAAIFGVFALATTLSASPAPAPDPSLTLFNGTSLLGWNAHGAWSASAGTITSNGTGNRNVLTAVPFADFDLQFEYFESASTGAKLRVWASHDDNGGFSIDLDNSDAPAGVGGIESVSNSSIKSVPSGWHRVQVNGSHGQLTVRVDGLPLGSTSGLGSRAGYMGFEASGSGILQLRNIKITPLGINNIFNNTDLSGWKSIAHSPSSKGGLGHSVERTFTMGMGGGSTKPHEAKWSVHDGAIHGEDGPGGLENGNAAEDAIIQLVASVKGEAKKENFTALLLRNTSGQLAGGYAVGVGPYAGGIENLQNHPIGSADTPVNETIIIGGRTIAVWIKGALVSVYTDSRPDSSNSAQGARTSAGAMTLALPNNKVQLDVQKFGTTVLPKVYGAPAHAPPPPPPVVQPVAQTAPAQPTAPSAAETAILQQQQNAAKKDATDQENKQRIATLMGQALATTDPQQQMNDYGQVVQIDPSNTAAVQGYKEAQQKVQAQQDAQAKANTSAMNEQVDAQTREQQTSDSLSKAQSAFLAGHLAAASTALAVAERLSPSNPLAHDLRARISAAQSLRTRLYFLGSGAGLLALVGMITLWLRRRKMQRFPVLEITRGLDSGLVLPLDKDAIRIGAVMQDGGQKNDIVIRDVEHAVSRFHCEIIKRDGQLYINDLNSSNGTRLNGTSIKPGSPELLRKGSRILLANTVELRFGYDRGAKTKTAT
jgi:hypothetical protein